MAAFPSLARRALAWLLDMAALFGIAVAVKNVDLMLWAVMPAWFVLLPLTPLEATPGKWVMGMRIAGMDGKRIAAWRAVVRYVASVASLAAAGLGYVVAAWTPRRQALHDLVAGSLVTWRAAPHAPPDAQAPRPHLAMRILWSLLIPAVALLFAFSIEFALARARYDAVVELNREAAGYLAEVEAALGAGKPLPLERAVPPSIQSLTTRPDGSVLLVPAEGYLPGGRIVFQRRAHPTEFRRWKCTVEGIRVSYEPAECRD